MNKIVINGVLGTNTDEKEYIYEEQGKYYKEDTVTLYDRGYADYRVMAYHQKINRDFIIRCPVGKYIEIKQFVESNEKDKIINLKMRNWNKEVIIKEELPQEIKVRLIKIILEDEKVEVLITSLIEKEKYSYDEFDCLYQKRWCEETYFDHYKNRLETEKFSSKKESGIEQDFYAMIFLSNLESIMIKEAEKDIKEEGKERNRKKEYGINKATSYLTIINNIVHIILDETRTVGEVSEELSILFKTNKSIIRPGRKLKRKKKTAAKRLEWYKYEKKMIA